MDPWKRVANSPNQGKCGREKQHWHCGDARARGRVGIQGLSRHCAKSAHVSFSVDDGCAVP